MPDTLAVFGGQFDPFHWGHDHVIRQLIPRFNQIIVLPCAHPPHRAVSSTPFHHRLAMTQQATAHWPNVRVSDYDAHHSPNWALHTLEHFQTQYPSATLTLVIGSDQYQVLHTWYRIDDLCAFAHIFVVPRDTHPFTNPHIPVTANVTHCAAPPRPLAATALRNRWAPEAVPEAVANYCHTHGLYL